MTRRGEKISGFDDDIPAEDQIINIEWGVFTVDRGKSYAQGLIWKCRDNYCEILTTKMGKILSVAVDIRRRVDEEMDIETRSGQDRAANNNKISGKVIKLFG